MKYTKREATILLAGVRKSIVKKWEPLASGKFRGSATPACAICTAHVKVCKSEWEALNPGPCPGCPLQDRLRRACFNTGHVFSKWCRALDGVGSFRRQTNTPRAVRAARVVINSLRRAKERLVKVLVRLGGAS